MTSLLAYAIYRTEQGLVIKKEVTEEFIPQTGLGTPKVQERNTIEITDTSARNALHADDGNQK